MISASAFSILDRFSVAAWNSTIRQAVNNDDPLKALLLFRRMKLLSHVRPNNLTFPFVAKACAKFSDLTSSRMIHAHVVKTPYCSDVYVQTAMIDMYVKCCSLNCAHQVFDEMSVRDVVSWNSMLVGFAQTGVFDGVSVFFGRMRADGVVPDAVTIMGLTQLVSKLKDDSSLRAVHCFGLKCGYADQVSVVNTWIAGYAKYGDFFSAQKLFCGIDLNSRSVVSWNAMIAGCAYFEESLKAIKIYRWMLCDEYKPDLSTFVNLLSSFSQPESLQYGMLIHAHAIKVGCDSSITLLNTLISVYSKCGDIGSSRYIFDKMKERSCVTWTIMIGGYSEEGNLDEALSLFHEMEAAGEKPNVITIVHLIVACGKIGALEVGKWIDNYTVSKGLKSEVMVCNALLDMYAKCGSLEYAEDLFRSMNEKTIVSWTTLISGFALNGKSQMALDHFDQMLKMGIKPNHITFLAVLQACSYAGLMEKGYEILHTMTEKYDINPGLHHYACMIDLLGRRGKLKEALELIREMPIKPDAAIWAALLSACKIHRNLEIGEYAARHLFRLEPQAAAPYVELASIYALANEWGGFADTCTKMKANRVMKCPGQSLIQVDGKLCSFMVEDRLHSQRHHMFEALDSLVLQLKDEINLIEFQS